MKAFLILIIFLGYGTFLIAQKLNPPNTFLLSEGSKTPILVHQLRDSSEKYAYLKPTLGLGYAKEALEISQEIDYPTGVAMSYLAMGTNLEYLGDYSGSMEFSIRGLNILKDLDEPNIESYTGFILALRFKGQGDYVKAIEYLKETEKVRNSDSQKEYYRIMHLTFPIDLTVALVNREIADCYAQMKNDSAIIFAQKAFHPLIPSQNNLYVMGKAFANMKQFDSAIYYYNKSLQTVETNPIDITKIRIGYANVFRETGMLDSTIYHANLALETAYDMNYLLGVNQASEILARSYEEKNPKKSIQFYKLHNETGDSLFSQQKTRAVHNMAFRQELQDREIKQKMEESALIYNNRLRISILAGGLTVLLIIIVGLWRRSVFKQKAFALVSRQKQEIEIQKGNVENTLNDLRATQTQLIQSEKMASLGELTAGIAHEIQNPLNFVNNFSEVNKELAEELKEEFEKGNTEEVIALIEDIVANEEKVTYHGKHAEGIVKSMLQHSRTGSGEKELTDINSLAEEYLRLAYHGFRAKDKSFNSDFKLELDETLPKIHIVPQDIGRVLLNLINNAFQAVNEKAKKENSDYKPLVTLKTTLSPLEGGPGGVTISVQDNGPGIPDSIIDKIFEPFFSTKPTGEGTGLGLSLSYDLVTKGHGGNISVAGQSGEGSTFIIQLPTKPTQS